jgi:NAD(P)-dependent dehydrogenase (short-subunit alcohol dehydrogenase family)
MRLKDKAIIVTGGTSGIGAAIATAAIREGAKVLIHGINDEEGRATVERLGANAVLCIADLNEDSAPQIIVKAALKAFGKIDGVVNNAAMFGGANIADQEIEHFRQMVQINLTAPLFLIKAAFEELKKTGGCVLNIGSINAHAGESKLLAYSISKGGMQTMTRNLANANGVHGIRVNQINPGWVLTEREYRDKMAVGLKPSWPQDLTRVDIPSGTMTTPEQMGEAAIYWLGDESKPFTGSVVDLEQFSIIGRNPEKLG